MNGLTRSTRSNLKQHDRVSSSSQFSRDSARDPQDKYDTRRNPEPIQRRIVVIIGDKRHTYDAPKHGEVTLTFHDGKLKYKEAKVKEKVE